MTETVLPGNIPLRQQQNAAIAPRAGTVLVFSRVEIRSRVKVHVALEGMGKEDLKLQLVMVNVTLGLLVLVEQHLPHASFALQARYQMPTTRVATIVAMGDTR